MSDTEKMSFIGPMSHSRWTTTASRVCRLYIATEKPSEALKLLVQYVLQVYAPLSLQIKQYPSCVMGARHIHQLMKLSRFLTKLVPSAVMKSFDSCIHRNGYFAHPENVLIAMCDDERPPIRALAYRRILTARDAVKETPIIGIREYKVPLLIYNAEDYVDMINWQRVASNQQMPPLLRDLIITEENIDELATFRITDPNFMGKIHFSVDGVTNRYPVDLKILPCHSQAVERCVKVVTEASKHVSGESEREGYIIAKLQHRRKMPSFQTKSQFVTKDIKLEPKP